MAGWTLVFVQMVVYWVHRMVMMRVQRQQEQRQLHQMYWSLAVFQIQSLVLE